jgi:NADPH2:quinone reductase
MVDTPNTVRAARLHTPGEPLAVGWIALAEPGPGEVVVDLRYAGVNPFDGYVAMGAGVVPADAPLPRTLGREAAGLLDGQPVLVHGSGLGLARDGVWASGAVVPESALLELPDEIDLREAATLPGAALTAYQAFNRAAQVGPDDRVLVLAAAGGVGHVLVALAADRGAQVWGQTTSAHKRDLIDAQGAHRVIVGGEEAIAELEPTVVFDALGGGFTAAAVEILASEGQLIAYGVSAGAVSAINMQTVYRKGLTIRGFVGFFLTPVQQRADLEALVGLVASDRVHSRVDDVIDLDDVNLALRRLRERDVAGKLVLELGQR